MDDQPVETHLPEPAARDEPIAVLYVGSDADSLDQIATTLPQHGDFEVLTETSSDAALDRLDGVDCLVCDHDVSTRDELLAAIRERQPTLPCILATDWTDGGSVDPLSAGTLTEFLRTSDAETMTEVLAGRVRRLVDHRRTQDLARRALTAVEATSDGVAVVGPDGRFTFVNCVYARRFGYDAEDLVGRPWQTCLPDDEVDRLESTALPTVRDDWQWTGGCVYRHSDGDTFTAQTRVAGLDDGTLVFCLSGS